MKFVDTAADTLLEYFAVQQRNPDLSLLQPRELEIRIHRQCRLVSLLFEYLGLFEGAEISETTAEVALPLRRFVTEVLPNSEVLLRGTPHLNYSITEVAEDMRHLFPEASSPMSESDKLPAAFYIIGVPPVEANEVLLNAILTHEIGHGIYERQNLADDILANVEVPHDLIKEWAEKIASQQESDEEEKPKTLRFPFQEVELRELLTKEVTGTITSWVTELSCDAIAIRILGPAYFFAFVKFFSTVALLDGASGSHPPPRLRLRLMLRYLQNEFKLEDMQPIRDFVSGWETAIMEKVDAGTSLAPQLASQAISDKVLSSILDAANSAVPTKLHYKNEDFVNDVRSVCPLLVENIPAVGADGMASNLAFASVLNAGWYVQIAEFDIFRKNLPEKIGSDAVSSRRQLDMLLLKSLELIELRQGWADAKLSIGGP